MSDNNSFSHLTLEERRIILTGITNNSQKPPLLRPLAKTSPRLERRSNFTGPSPTNATSLWSVPLTVSVSMDAHVPLTALSISPSAVPGGTAPLVPATAAPTGVTAASTSTPIPQKMPISITGKCLLIPGRVSI